MRLFPLGHHLALGGFSSVGARASLQGADRAAGSLPGRPAAGPGPALPGARGRGRHGAGGRGSGREGRGEPRRPRSGRLSPAVSPSPSACVSLRLPLFLSVCLFCFSRPLCVSVPDPLSPASDSGSHSRCLSGRRCGFVSCSRPTFRRGRRERGRPCTWEWQVCGGLYPVLSVAVRLKLLWKDKVLISKSREVTEEAHR